MSNNVNSTKINDPGQSRLVNSPADLRPTMSRRSCSKLNSLWPSSFSMPRFPTLTRKTAGQHSSAWLLGFVQDSVNHSIPIGAGVVQRFSPTHF